MNSPPGWKSAFPEHKNNAHRENNLFAMAILIVNYIYFFYYNYIKKDGVFQ